MTCTLDTTVLTQRLDALAEALYGRGSGDGEVQQALKAETGQLAGRIGDVIGPRTKTAATKRTSRDIKSSVAILMEGNLEEMPGVKYADWTWLDASPRALTGIKNADYQVHLDGHAALDFFRGEQKKPSRGPIYKQIGIRGEQHIMQVDRGAISPKAYGFIFSDIMTKMGELAGAFYNVAVRYVPRKRVTAFVGSKMPQAEAKQKSRVEESGMSGMEPAIEFTVDGKGLEGNPKLVAKIQLSVNGTAKSMEMKLQKLGRGAKYVFETGQVYFEKEADDL